MKDYGPKVTNLTGVEFSPSASEQARALWLLQKYSSLTFIRRMAGLFFNFVAGYEEFSREEKTRVGFHRENLASFYGYQALLTKGIEQLERGEPTGYAPILQGCFFHNYFRGRRFESGLENEEIGWRYPDSAVGLYAWAKVAMNMQFKVDVTLRATWAFPHVLDPRVVNFAVPENLRALPGALGPSVDTDQEVPISGVWLPVTIPSGCPNYLWAGRDAPAARRATKRLYYPHVESDVTPQEAHVEYEYGPEASRWELLWEDHRYEHGQLPDESIYLDPTTEPPPWPPRVIPGNEDDPS